MNFGSAYLSVKRSILTPELLQRNYSSTSGATDLCLKLGQIQCTGELGAVKDDEQISFRPWLTMRRVTDHDFTEPF